MWSDLTLDTFFKVRRGFPIGKSVYDSFIIDPTSFGYEPDLYEMIGWESFNVVRFDL